MIVHNFRKLLTLSATLILLSIPQLRAETNTVIPIPDALPVKRATEIADTLPVKRAADLAPLQKLCQRQVKGLLIVNSCLKDIFSFSDSPALPAIEALLPWLEQKLTPSAFATYSVEDIAAQVLLHGTIGEFCAKCIDKPDALPTPLVLEQKFKELKENVTPEMVSQLPKLIEVIDQHINILLAKTSEDHHEFLTTIITKQRAQLSRLQEILQLLVIKIGQSTMKDKNQIKEHIINLRNQIQIAYQSINQQGPTPPVIKALHSIIIAITENLEDAGKNYLQIAPLSEEQIAREMQREVDFLTIAQELPILTERIEDLEKYAEIADLSWAERAARNVYDYAISPVYNHRYAIGFIACTAAFAFTAWWHLGLPGFTRLRNWLGGDRWDSVNSYSQAMNNRGTEPILSRADRAIGDMTNIKAAFLFGTFSASAYMGKKVWQQYRMSETIENVIDYFKGGIYRQHALKKTDNLAQVNFDDVIGMEQAKEQINQIFNYFHNSERWILAGLNVPTTILFKGKTRAGKTFFANAIRGQANMEFQGKIKFTFREVTHEEITTVGLKDILGIAKQYWAPCILWIDELHLLHLQDVGNSKVLTDVLTALSGLDMPDPKRPVVVIAGTNKPETLSAALRQKGRFAVEILFEYPSLAERALYLTKKLSSYGIDPQIFNINVNKLARETEGCTFEILSSLISDAFIQINMKGGTLSQEILEHAIDVEIRKIVFHDNKHLPEEERRFLSAFWSGVAVACNELPTKQQVSCVTTLPVLVTPKEEMLGKDLVLTGEDQTQSVQNKEEQPGIVRGKMWTNHIQDTAGFETEEQRVAHIKTYLAGRAAERVLLGTNSSYYNSMRQWAFEQIKSLVTGGLDFTKLSHKAQDELMSQAQERLAQYEREVEALLVERKDILTVMSEILFHQQKLNGDEVKMIIAEAKKHGAELVKLLTESKDGQPTRTMPEVNLLEKIDSISAQQVPVAA